MAPVSTQTDTPQLELEGKALGDRFLDKLLSAEVRLSVHTSGAVRVELDDPWLELFDGGGIDVGNRFAVKLPDESGKLVEVFNGRVTTIGVDHEQDSTGVPRARFVFEARDDSHRLAIASKFEAHEKTAKEVVEAIAKRHKLKPKVGKLPDVGGDKYIIQTGTDHALLTELARRYGCEWFTDGDELHFRPRPTLEEGATVSRVERTLLHFSARYTGANTPKSVDVLGWDPAAAKSTKAAKGKSDIKPTPTDLGSNAPFVGEQAKNGQKAFGQPLAVGDLASVSEKENQAIADSLVKELVGSGLRAEGEAECNPKIKAGGYVRIDGFGKKLSGSYYVTEVTHVFGAGQELLTRFRCTGHSVEPPPWQPVAGAASSSAAWAAGGPVVGVVTNIKDPKNQGRVKVKFPSLGDIESAWARVVTVGAGPERGIDFRPEPNDEVLVVFERGDARFPLVVGGLWNGKTKLPPGAATEGDEGSSVSTSRVIRSRSGHALEFSDGGANEAAGSNKRFISLTSGDKKSKVVVNEKDGITIEAPDGNEITLKAGSASLTLKKNGDIEVKTAKGKFLVDAPQVIAKAKAKVEIKSNGSALLEASGKLDVKSSGLANVQAGGIMTVKGAMVKIN